MSTETDNNKKFINVTQLDRALQALNNRHEEVESLLLDTVDNLAIIKADKTELERVEGMFDGKALRYVTQEEYDVLSDKDKTDETIAWCITDRPVITSNDLYDSLNTEDKTIIGAINELEYEIFNAHADIVGLEEYKQDKEDENLNTEDKTIVGAINEIESALSNIGDLDVSNAEAVNGYSVWVGTSAELDQIEDRDENTIYFEIDEEADASNRLVNIEIVDGILTLTNDKRQKAEMVDGTEIVLPAVTNFTEIHLYFSTLTDLTLIFPAGKYQKTPVINANKTYEFIFTYIGEWLIGYIEYGN